MRMRRSSPAGRERDPGPDVTGRNIDRDIQVQRPMDRGRVDDRYPDRRFGGHGPGASYATGSGRRTPSPSPSTSPSRSMHSAPVPGRRGVNGGMHPDRAYTLGLDPRAGAAAGAGGPGGRRSPSPMRRPAALPYGDPDEGDSTFPRGRGAPAPAPTPVPDAMETDTDDRIPPPRHPHPAQVVVSPVAHGHHRNNRHSGGAGKSKAPGGREAVWGRRPSMDPAQPQPSQGQVVPPDGLQVPGAADGGGAQPARVGRQSWADRAAVPAATAPTVSSGAGGEADTDVDMDVDMDMDMDIESDTPKARDVTLPLVAHPAPGMTSTSGSGSGSGSGRIGVKSAAYQIQPSSTTDPSAGGLGGYAPPPHPHPPFPPNGMPMPTLPPFPPNAVLQPVSVSASPLAQTNGIHGNGIRIDLSGTGTNPAPSASAPPGVGAAAPFSIPIPLQGQHAKEAKGKPPPVGRNAHIRNVFDASREGSPVADEDEGNLGFSRSGGSASMVRRRSGHSRDGPPADRAPPSPPPSPPRRPPPPPSAPSGSAAARESQSTTPSAYQPRPAVASSQNGILGQTSAPALQSGTSSSYVPRNSAVTPTAAPSKAAEPEAEVPPAPYIRAAFEQWYSQTMVGTARSQDAPSLPVFLVHFFGRPPMEDEITAVEGLWRRRQAADAPQATAVPASVPAPTGASGPADGVIAVSNGGDSTPTQVTPASLPPGEVYERLACVGEGTYGKVYKARNVYSNAFVALKRIRMEGEKEGFPVTAMREIKLLQGLRHKNVIRLVEMMVSKGSVYMVFEYMELDLTGLLAHPDVSFTPANIKSLTYQMLDGLAYLHDRSILHRDLKGSNILLSSTGVLKLADFGLARFYNKRARDDYTNRVITLWYRSPELLLGETVYQGEVDMWSAGCIALELFVTKPVFQGQDEISQLSVIWDVLGTPDSHGWTTVEELPWYELVRPKVSIPDRFESNFTKWLPTPHTRDLVKGMLTLDPALRMSAVQAMKHQYFAEDPQGEVPNMRGMGEWHEMDAKASRRKREGR